MSTGMRNRIGIPGFLPDKQAVKQKCGDATCTEHEDHRHGCAVVRRSRDMIVSVWRPCGMRASIGPW